jgi:gamma-glutamylcysteine synthetase
MQELGGRDHDAEKPAMNEAARVARRFALAEAAARGELEASFVKVAGLQRALGAMELELISVRSALAAANARLSAAGLLPVPVNIKVCCHLGGGTLHQR